MDKLDVLNRKAFVDQLLKLVENISTNKSSTCFAINGAWGCGKSFVLDMFEEKLSQIQSEETATDKYFIIRYNSWKFDYYEEPLIAIVSTIISTIEEKTKLFPDDKKKREVLGMLKATGISLLSIANNLLKEQTGVDAQKAFETILNGQKEGAELYESEHDYDFYFGFNKVMSKLMLLLQNIAKNYTVILLVDELDRCLPQYAVRVLERLHHLTEGKSNIITVISIDKTQLMASIKQIFGFENPEKYLEKFINFEIKLDCGTVTERITEKYSDYMELFDKELFQFDEPVEECLQAIFKDIDIRTQEQLVSKAMMVHKLLYTDKKDYSFMCMELLLIVMICVYKDDSCFSDTSINCSSFNKVFITSIKSIRPAFVDFFTEKFENIYFCREQSGLENGVNYVLPEKANLYCSIIFTWYWMHKVNRQIVFQYTVGGAYEPIAKNHEDLKKFVEMINLLG